jgi:hypothetical protein
LVKSGRSRTWISAAFLLGNRKANLPFGWPTCPAPVSKTSEETKSALSMVGSPVRP